MGSLSDHKAAALPGSGSITDREMLFWAAGGKITDAGAESRMAIMANTDPVYAAALQRQDWEDTAQWTEDMASIADWTTNARQQINANKLYSLASLSYPAGMTRALPGLAAGHITAAQKVRVLGQIYTPGSGVGANVILGVDSQDVGNANLGVTSIAGIGFDGGVPSVFNFGAVAAIPGAAVAAAGVYDAMVVVDEAIISMVLTTRGAPADHVWEYRYQMARPAGFIGQAAAYVYDARALTGHYIGPIQVRTGMATCSPRTIEGLSSRVTWTTAQAQVPPIGGANQKLRISTGAAYDSRVPAPVCIYFHGAGETAQAPNDQLPLTRSPMFQSLEAAGYIVASCDASGDNWGNAVSVEDYVVLYRYLRDHFSIGPICFFSDSMGAMDALITLSESRIPNVVAMYMVEPVVDLRTLYSTFQASINTAYGTPGATSLPAAALARLPILKSGAAFRGVPMRFVASYADTTAIRATNTDPFKTLVEPYAPESSVVTATGNHGDASHYVANDARDFFNKYVRS